MAEVLTYEGGELTLFHDARCWKQYLRNILAPYICGRVLEVGAGLGGTTAYLMDLGEVWICLEPDAALAAQIPKTLSGHAAAERVSIHVGTLCDLKEHNCFDTILYIDVLEHIKADREEVALAVTRLTDGGRLIVLAPAHKFFFTPFDTQIGHYRRYDKKSLQSIMALTLQCETLHYLDSVGMLASLGNRLFLKRSMPTVMQISVWDRYMVPLSAYLDPLFGYHLGKSILGVWKYGQGKTIP